MTRMRWEIGWVVKGFMSDVREESESDIMRYFPFGFKVEISVRQRSKAVSSAVETDA